jgi:hypothetical protein
MRSAWARASTNGETVTSFQDALIAAAMAEKAAPYIHPRLAAAKHEVSGTDGEPLLAPIPQVVIYMPDNGRDPDLVKPVADPRVEVNSTDRNLVRLNGEDQLDH